MVLSWTWRWVLTGFLAATMAAAAPAASALELTTTLPPTWISRVDTGGFDLGQGVALADDGSVFVAGTAENEEGKDIVTVKLDAAGKEVWSRVIDKGPSDRGEDVALDAEGNAYVVGTIGTAVGDDVIVAKYLADGTLAWSVVLDKGTSETARAIEVARDGHLLVAGASLSVHGADAFVAKLTPAGKEVWSRPVNLYFVDEGFAVAGDGEGGVVLAGRVLRGSSFDLLVRKWDADGNLAWSRLVATPAAEEARGVAVDAAGTVHAFGTVRTGGKDGQADALLARFAADGESLGTEALDIGGADDEGRGIAFDPAGNLVLSGFCVCDGTKDPFILKLTPSLELVWGSILPGDGIDGVGSVDVSADGARIVVAGATQRAGSNFDYLVAAFDQGRPLAMFRHAEAPLEAGTPVTFEDLSVPLLMPLKSRHWDFGDGATATAPLPMHTYRYGGTYRVVLTVTDAFHNVDRYEKELVVAGPAPPGPSAAEDAPDADDPPASTERAAVDVEEDPPAPAAAETPAVSLLALVAASVAAALVSRRR